MAKINLNIEATDAEDLRQTLSKLLGANPVNVTVNKVEAKDPDRFVNEVKTLASAEAAAADADRVARHAPTPEPEKPAEAPKPRQTRAKKTEPVASATETVASDNPVSEPQPTPEVTPEPAKNSKAKNVQAAIVDGPSADTVSGLERLAHMPDSVKNAQNMRELLTWMSENGVGDIDTLVSACASIKGQVPILQKVPDVDARVRRAAEVLGLFAPADEAETAAG